MNLYSVVCGLSATLLSTVLAHYFVFEFRNGDCNSPPLYFIPGGSKHDLHQPVQRLGAVQDGHGTSVGRDLGIRETLQSLFGPRFYGVPAHDLPWRTGLERH